MFENLPFGRNWRSAALAGLLGLALPLGAQAQRVLWADNTQVPEAGRREANALYHYRSIDVNLDAIRAALLPAPVAQGVGARNSSVVISLPLPEGGSQRYRVVQAATMAPALADLFPLIKTYQAQGIDDPTATAAIEVSPRGFHAMVIGAGHTFYVDPAGDAAHGLVFNASDMDMRTRSFVCSTDAGTPAVPSVPLPLAARQPNGTVQKTYRLALACTPEYATAVCPPGQVTIANTMAAMVISVARINNVYGKELAVQLQMVANNNLLLYIPNGPNTPSPAYTNSSGSAMLNQNQTNVDRVIGSANYDIGHVFSTGGGGIAQKPSVCVNGGKARGVTGSPSPVGDAFDIDYVAHEMGHQFNCNHTFNNNTNGSCGGGNRNAGTAYEPGSGITIMAYAGICSPEDIDPHSIPYFHSASFDEALVLINGTALACAAQVPTTNTPPVPNAGRNYSIPKSTPFALTGSGTDADAGDVLTYSWEQFDLNPATTTVAAPSGNAPIFTVLTPTTSPTRYFPRLSNLVANTAFIGERLPTYARRMVFRLVARDNRVGGGAFDYDSMTVGVSGTAGPFLVTLPNTAGISWQAGAPNRVTWDVAGTTAAPISAANVDILLSTDGGFTYPTVLLANTPNDGVEAVTVPVATPGTTTARIMVRASGNVFFDISNQNFTIEANNGPTFFVAPAIPATPLTVCPSATATTSISVGQISGFTGTVALAGTNLPTGITLSFAPASAAAGSTSTATISVASTVAAGTYSLTVTGTSGTVTRSQTFDVTVLPAPTTTPTPTTPLASAPSTTRRPLFSWSAIPSITTYELQVATNATFTTGLQTYTVTGTSFAPTAQLVASSTYYWRVRAVSTCGSAPYTAVQSFTTGQQACATTVATNVPRTIQATANAVATSVIAIASTDRVGEVLLQNLDITHADVSELEVTLTNPAGVTVVVIPRGSCAATANVLLNFDDLAANALACPLTGNGTVRPANPLIALANGTANGNWTLTVTDFVAGNAGRLNAWSLNLCTVAEPPLAPTSILAQYVNQGNTDIYWTTDATGPQATSFEIQRSYLNNTSYTTIATGIPVSAGGVYRDNSFTASGRYYYRVRGCNVVGCSPYTAEYSVLGTRLNAQAAGIAVTPNPSTGLFALTIDNPQHGAIALRVTDALGRTVASETLTKTGAALQHTVDLSKLAPGVYHLHLALPDGTVVQRLLKQ